MEFIQLSFLSPLFWILFGYFWIAIILSWYIPGSLLMPQDKLTTLPRITLSVLLGLILWAWQGWIFGVFHIRWATHVYILCCVGIWFKKYKFSVPKIGPIDRTSFVILAIGILLQQIPIWFEGILTSRGLSFCCVLPINPIGHIALTYETLLRVPPYEAGVSGITLANYHYWVNLAVADLVRIFRLPLLYTQIQYFSLFTSLFAGLTAITLSRTLKLSMSFQRWFLFFIFFASDAIMFIPLLFGRNISWQPAIFDNGVWFLTNIPTAVSVVLFFASLVALVEWIRSDFQKYIVSVLLFFGSLVGFKVHTAILALCGLLFVSMYFLTVSKRKPFFMFLGVLILACIIYIPLNKGAGGLYPSWFWRIEQFARNPAFGIHSAFLAHITFLTKQKRLLIEPLSVQMMTLFFEAGLFAFYIVSVFGTQLISLFQSKRSLLKIPPFFHVFLITFIGTGCIAGIFFLQTSGVGHTEVFLHVVFYTLPLLAALSCAYVCTKGRVAVVKTLFIMLITIIPSLYTAYISWQSAMNPSQYFTISQDELKALSYLRLQTPKDSLILVDPGNRVDSLAPYVGFLAQRPMYFSGSEILGSHNVKTGNRRDIVYKIFHGMDMNEIKSALKTEVISYLYLLPTTHFANPDIEAQLITTVQNNEVKLLRVP